MELIPPERREDVQRRFEKFVRKTDSCWLWTGQVSNGTMHMGGGYGTFSVAPRQNVRAHRVAYELYKGPMVEGLEIDHLCKVRFCVNPDHLELVTHAENVRRAREGRLREFCKRGHALEEPNLYIYRGVRSCLTCRRASARGYYHRTKARQIALN